MSFSAKNVRYALIGLVAAAGVALAPAAMARSHVNIGLNIGLPGVAIGYSNWGGGYGFAGNYGYGGYYPSYAPVYYGPAYYSPAYYGPAYGPAYYSRPAYRVGYSSAYSSRGYYGPSRVYYDGDRGHRGGSHRSNYGPRGGSSHRADYGQRGQYYDRGGRR